LVLEVARRAPRAEVVLVHIDAVGQLGHELSRRRRALSSRAPGGCAWR
jgi:hypothetical protein